MEREDEHKDLRGSAKPTSKCSESSLYFHS